MSNRANKPMGSVRKKLTIILSAVLLIAALFLMVYFTGRGGAGDPSAPSSPSESVIEVGAAAGE